MPTDTDQPSSLPNHLEAAKSRLQRAIARLESAVRANPPSAGGMDESEFAARLSAVQTDYAALRSVSETISARLDSTMERLQTVLER